MFKAARAAEQAIEGHGNDRSLYIFHDPLQPATEFQQLPDARDLSLGKNTDHFSRANRIAGRLQRNCHLMLLAARFVP